MKMSLAWFAAPFFILASAPAFAHAGAHHGSLMEIISHLFSQPDHRVLIVITLVSCLIGLALVPDAKPSGSSNDPR